MATTQTEEATDNKPESVESGTVQESGSEKPESKEPAATEAPANEAASEQDAGETQDQKAAEEKTDSKGSCTADESQIVELSTEAFKAFCNDISAMFSISMKSQHQEATIVTIEALKEHFKNLAAVTCVKADGALDGTFQIILSREGLFTLAGAIAMPAQMTSLLEKCVGPEKTLKNIKSGSLKEAEEVGDTVVEACNLLIGSWDRIFRKGLEGHGHLLQTNTFIGDPWDNPKEKIDLVSDEEFVFASYKITISSYPAFDCGVIFPKTIFTKVKPEAEEKAKDETEEKPKTETEAKPETEVKTEATADKDKPKAEEKAKAEAEEKAKAEAEEKAKAEAEEKAKAEAEEKAKAEAEEKAKAEAEEKAKAEAEKNAKAEAEEKAKAEAEEKAKAEAEEKAKAEAEEKAKVEAEEKVKAEAEEKAKAEAEEKAKAEAEEKAKVEAEEKVKAEAEEKAKAEAEEKAKAEAEEKAKAEAVEEKTEAKPETSKEPKTEAETKTETTADKDKPKAEAKQESEEKAETKAETTEKPEAVEEKAKAETEEKAKDETEEKPKAETKAKPETEVKTEATADKDKPKTEAKQESEEKAETKAEVKTEGEAEAKPQTEEKTSAPDQSQEPTKGKVSETIQKMAQSPAILPGESGKATMGHINVSSEICATDIMQKELVWATSEESVQQAMTKMQQHDSGYIMIGKDGILEGIVSKSDITGATSIYLRPIFAKWYGPLDDATLQIKLKWIMSRPVRTVRPETPLVTIIENVCRFGGRGLPVVDEQGKVQGLVTVFDIFRTLLNTGENVSAVGKTVEAPALT